MLWDEQNIECQSVRRKEIFCRIYGLGVMLDIARPNKWGKKYTSRSLKWHALGIQKVDKMGSPDGPKSTCFAYDAVPYGQ